MKRLPPPDVTVVRLDDETVIPWAELSRVARAEVRAGIREGCSSGDFPHDGRPYGWQLNPRAETPDTRADDTTTTTE